MLQRVLREVAGVKAPDLSKEIDAVLHQLPSALADALDAVRNIGIRDGKIILITTDAIGGKVTLDAKGLVVAPGFIDLHSHGQTTENYRYKARDGVTTALEMEVGVNPVDAWYRDREGRAQESKLTHAPH